MSPAEVSKKEKKSKKRAAEALESAGAEGSVAAAVEDESPKKKSKKSKDKSSSATKESSKDKDALKVDAPAASEAELCPIAQPRESQCRVGVVLSDPRERSLTPLFALQLPSQRQARKC